MGRKPIRPPQTCTGAPESGHLRTAAQGREATDGRRTRVDCAIDGASVANPAKPGHLHDRNVCLEEVIRNKPSYIHVDDLRRKTHSRNAQYIWRPPGRVPWSFRVNERALFAIRCIFDWASKRSVEFIVRSRASARMRSASTQGTFSEK